MNWTADFPGRKKLKMKYLSPFLLVIVILFTACSVDKKNINYVDPFIGTGGHGHTYPGATLPFGMVQLSPDTRINSWDGCSGYHYSDKTILGFSHTHLSGTGVGDYGDIRFMPTVGKLQLNPGTADYPDSGYSSRFSHKTEKASPGYYAVTLEDYDIDVELTVSERVGFQKYIFPETDNAHIIIDLTESITSDKILYLELEFLSNTEITGVRRTDGWADDQCIYFYAVFSKPFDSFGVVKNGKISKVYQKVYGEDIKAFVNYKTSENEEILVKVGISAVSIEGAKNNFKKEIQGWDFKETKNKARKIWEKALNKIKVEGGTIEQKTIFYTALYHSLLAPNLFSDIDGKYRGHDGKTYKAKDFDMYTVFSLWDTFRAEHPLFTIIENKRTTDFIKSMLDIYKRSGLLPVWELAGNETGCMIGYHSVPVIVDAYMKGIRDYDIKLIFNAMKNSAEQNHLGLEFYKKSGYIPADKEGESVSKTLEYAYDDWCIAQMAKKLGKDKDYRKYIIRAQYYKNLFDDLTGFFRGKRNETFVTPFNPAEVNFMLTEANTWQYNFFVPQDIHGMIDLLGGNEQFAKKLDEMFYTETKLSGRHQSDITGLIGQYAHGNEPSHHIAYLYDYAGQPWKTQKLVRKIMDDLYSDKPDGLCGNEDCGQMSAWYVLSAMGFYPVTPGYNIYAIGSPVFEKVTINLENGNKFIIKANNVSDDNFYIQSASLNGKPFNKSYIKHSNIMKGGELVFEMGPEPNKNWGTGKENVPVSEIKDFLITPVPYFIADSKTFTKTTEVKLNCILKDAKIYYTLDGSKPDINSKEYTKPLKLNKTTTIKTFAVVNGLLPSKKVTAEFIKIPGGRSIKINNPYSPHYTGGGDIALIDFIRGSNNFRTGDWQGYEGIDLDVIIDLGKIQKINQISTGFLLNQNSWIFMPTQVDYKISTDGKYFKAVGSVFNDIPENYNRAIIKDFTLKNINKKTRYIRVLAKNIVVCPDWHKGAGEKAWIFADEIVVE